MRDVSATLSEYKSDKETEKIFVQYRRNKDIAERIEVVYSSPLERAAVISVLDLPASPSASRTNAKGKLEEYFSPKYVVLTYTTAEASRF